MKKNKFYFLIILLLQLCNTIHSAHAQQDDQQRRIEVALPVMDQLFKTYAAKNHFPGATYGLVVDGKLIHTSSMGFTDPDKKIPVTAQTAFRIASMTKSFTAMAILKLRDLGKLKLDDRVDQYIPAMKGQRYLTTDASPVTIRQLLTHAAGFPEDNPWGDRQLDITEEAMLNMIKKGISFSTVPGTGYEYSNMGFAMLGYIIKKVSGLSYQQYITRYILQPLGMTHSYWDYTRVPGGELAHGYRRINGRWIEQPMLKDGAYGAMGGLICSMEDFAKYVSFHLSAWPARNDEDSGLLKRSSIREMHQPWNINTLLPAYQYPGGRPCPIVTAYGYGLRWIKDCNNKVITGHSGGLPGFGSDWRMLADYGIGIISFGNLTYAAAGLLNTQLLDTLVSMAKLRPVPLPVSAILNQRKNDLVLLLPGWNNAGQRGIFAKNFFMDYDADSLRREATALFNKAGKITRIHELIATNHLRGTFIMEGENANLKIGFTLTPENPPLIQAYQIREVEKK